MRGRPFLRYHSSLCELCLLLGCASLLRDVPYPLGPDHMGDALCLFFFFRTMSFPRRSHRDLQLHRHVRLKQPRDCSAIAIRARSLTSMHTPATPIIDLYIHYDDEVTHCGGFIWVLGRHVAFAFQQSSIPFSRICSFMADARASAAFPRLPKEVAFSYSHRSCTRTAPVSRFSTAGLPPAFLNGSIAQHCSRNSVLELFHVFFFYLNV
jgi:hypothetical protein